MYACRAVPDAFGYGHEAVRLYARSVQTVGIRPKHIAHFAEHTIFKGTSHKSASVINGYLDRLGGELNAFTTKEEIVLHATVLKEDLPKAAREYVDYIEKAVDCEISLVSVGAERSEYIVRK